MHRTLVHFAIAAAFLAAILLLPTNAAADSMIGSVTLTYLYPTSTTPLAPSQVIAVGSSLTCPNASVAMCFGSSNIVYTIGPNSLTYSSNTTGTFTTSSFNGYQFSGITFASGAPISGFILTTNIAGMTASNVTFDASNIFVNMQGLNGFGTFTVTPTTNAIGVPEPGTLSLLGAGLFGLASLVRRRKTS